MLVHHSFIKSRKYMYHTSHEFLLTQEYLADISEHLTQTRSDTGNEKSLNDLFLPPTDGTVKFMFESFKIVRVYDNKTTAAEQNNCAKNW